VRAEQALRFVQIVRDDLQLELRLLPLRMQRRDARVNARKLTACLCETRIECVETEQGAVRPRRERALMLFQRP
jgi:hypothetical protein